MLKLQEEQAAALAAENRIKNLDLSYVDPTSGGRFGQADIARALAPSPEQNYKPQPSPVGGNNKPSNTSRQLNYGLRNIAPEGDTNGASTAPGGYIPANMPLEAVALPNPAGQDPSIDGQPASDATLQALLSPTTGGIYANNPITGVNSPLTQGTV